MTEMTLAGIDPAARFIASRRLRRCDTPRYAVYFAPQPASAWWRFGCSWLGRDALDDARPSTPPDVDLDPGYVRSITIEPRRYGFHATLKAPFRLASGHDVTDLHLQMALLARELTPFTLPPLAAAVLDGFVALAPSGPCPAVATLAERCVVAFENVRAPLDRAELARRQLSNLTVRQSALLAQWGYPYVFDEFRFHFTMTAKLRAAERLRTLEALAPAVESLNASPMRVDALSLFIQHAPHLPFVLTRCYPFGASAVRPAAD